MLTLIERLAEIAELPIPAYDKGLRKQRLVDEGVASWAEIVEANAQLNACADELLRDEAAHRARHPGTL